MFEVTKHSDYLSNKFKNHETASTYKYFVINILAYYLVNILKLLEVCQYFYDKRTKKSINFC